MRRENYCWGEIMIKYHTGAKVGRIRHKQRAPCRTAGLKWKRIWIFLPLGFFLAAGVYQAWHKVIWQNKKPHSTRLRFTGSGTKKAGVPKITSGSDFQTKISWAKPTRDFYIIRPFGWCEDPANREWMFHPGVDIKTAEGEPVYAAMQGTVAEESLSASGWTVVIKHSPDLISIYKYLSQIKTRRGQVVEAGQLLGLSANRQQEEAGLHFGIYQDQAPLDPAALLK